MFKTGQSLSSQYEQLKAFLRHLKAQAIRHRDNTRDITTTVTELLSLLKEADDRLATVPAGLVLYAQQQENDVTYDVSAELAAVRSSVQGRIGWIVANVPTINGVAQERFLNADGTLTNIEVTPEKAAEAVAEIQIVIDAIE